MEFYSELAISGTSVIRSLYPGCLFSMLVVRFLPLLKAGTILDSDAEIAEAAKCWISFAWACKVLQFSYSMISIGHANGVKAGAPA